MKKFKIWELNRKGKRQNVVDIIFALDLVEALEILHSRFSKPNKYELEECGDAGLHLWAPNVVEMLSWKHRGDDCA